MHFSFIPCRKPQTYDYDLNWVEHKIEWRTSIQLSVLFFDQSSAYFPDSPKGVRPSSSGRSVNSIKQWFHFPSPSPLDVISLPVSELSISQALFSLLASVSHSHDCQGQEIPQTFIKQTGLTLFTHLSMCPYWLDPSLCLFHHQRSFVIILLWTSDSQLEIKTSNFVCSPCTSQPPYLSVGSS